MTPKTTRQHPPELDTVDRAQGHLRWDMRRDLAATDVAEIKARLVPAHFEPGELPPDPGVWGGNLARGIVEVLDGMRPLSQLRRWVVPGLYTEIGRLSAPRGRRVEPVGSYAHSRVCMITPRIAEVSVVLKVGDRLRGVALRLEVFRDRWIATALDVI